jgi:hypothetical protein
MLLDGATIEILNWDKYNPRKDLKSTTWVRLQNSLFEDPNFFDFDHSEILFWIYLLSLASKKQCGEIRLSIPHAERIGRFKKSVIESALKKLQQLQCVRIDETNCDSGVTPKSREDHTTNERDETNARNVTVAIRPQDGLASPTTNQVWEAYREQYQRRYGTNPIRNAKINSQIKSFCTRIPIEEAPEVARYFVGHNNAYYVAKGHAIGIMLQDAEKLRTEWATGKQITKVDAHHVDRKQSNLNAWAPLLAEATAREKAGKDG